MSDPAPPTSGGSPTGRRTPSPDRNRSSAEAAPESGPEPGRQAPAAAVDPPRLLVAVTHPMTADLLMRGHLAALVERGFRVGVLSAPGPRLEEVARREGVEVFPVPLRREPAPRADLLAVLRTVRVLRRFRPHLVSAGTPKAGLVVGLAGWLARVPRRLYVVRGLRLETVRGWRRLVLALVERLTSLTAHRVACVSESLRQRYVELGLATDRKTLVPGDGASNGVDAERFRPAADPGSSGGRTTATSGATSLAPLEEDASAGTGVGTGATASDPEWLEGLPEGVPVVGFVGRFTRDKGIADLAAAFFDHLLPRFPEARLLLLGGWEEGDPVDPETRRRLEEDPRVLRPGFVPDSAPGYRRMDVLAFPSYREGFPNAPLEAAASGVPVVGYDVTGTKDAVARGETGTLVPSGDVPALAAALAAYLSDPVLRHRHGTAARRRAVDLFRNEKVWQSWCDLYVQELQTAGLPTPKASPD